MTAAEIARADQLAAKEREFDRKAAHVARYVLLAYCLLGAYCLVAALGRVPAAPWSALG